MNDFPVKNLGLGLIGGAIGAVLGGLGCVLLADSGFYSVMLPGALLGLGFGLAARRRHIAFGVICGVLGLLAGLITQWKVYSNEPSFFKLVGELKDYSIVTWVMLGLGAVMAFSFGMGRNSYSRSSNQELQ